jgi:hypothetical protein
MKLRVIILFLGTILLGCSKEQKEIDMLEGNWELVSYNQLYINGLSSPIPSTGILSFVRYKTKKTSTGSFTRTQHYTSKGSEVHIQEDGAYSVNEQGKGLKLTIIQPNGTNNTELQLELNTITKTDLKIIGVYDNIQHTFVYQKIK